MTHDIPLTDDRLDALLADYFQRLDAGEPVSPTSLVASHPDLATPLREFFDAASFVENLAGPTHSEHTQMLSVNDTARSVLIGETIVSGIQSAPSRASAKDDAFPQHFGRYEIQRLLGQGAMGAVYLAYDPSLQRQVALKIPKFNADENADMSNRFLREARSAATLRHANICPVYDVGRVDGVHYITMAYIEGRTLAEELRAGRTFQPREIATIVRKLALALSKAHGAGVVHRDLKPGNIMLDPDGEPILMDFGLAYREETDELRLTKSGMIVGSPAYMSPEQIDGDPTKIGPASDVYSLGVVLYEMITGKLPFSGTMMSVIGQIATKEPTPVGHWRKELADSPLERLCRKMLAKQPGQRPSTMQDVAAALDYVLSGLRQEGESGREGEGETSKSVMHQSPPLPLAPSPALFTPPAPSVKFPETVLAQERRDRARMFLATTLILAALVGLFGALAGVIYVATNKGTLQITSSVDNVQVEVASKDGTIKVIDLTSGTEVHRLPLGDYTIKVKGERTDVFLDHNGFNMSRGGKVIVEAQLIRPIPGPVSSPPPVAVDQPAIPPPTRLSGPQPVVRLTDHAGSVRAIAFDPDGQHFVTAGFDNTIRRRRLADGQQVSQIDTGRHSAYRAAFDSRGRLVTSGLDSTVRLWDLAAGHELVQSTDHAKPVAALAILPGGKTAITGSWDGALRLWNLEKTDDNKSLADSAGTVWDIDLTPGGKQAAVADFRGPVTLWDLEGKEPPVELGKHEGGALAVVYVGQGEKLLSAGRDGAIKLWDVAERKLLREQSFSGVWIESLGVSPDGKYALLGLSAPDKVPNVDPAAGQCVVWDLQEWQGAARLYTGMPCIYAAEFSPDGKLIVTGGGQHGNAGGGGVSLWRLEDVLKHPPAQAPATDAAITEVLQIAGHVEHVTSLAVTGDGKTVVSGSADGTVLARDIQPRLTRRAFSGHRRDRQVTVDVSRDGKLIVSGDWDGKLRLNVAGKEVTEIDAHPGGVMSATLSPDETRLLTTGGDNTGKIWNVATGELLHTLQGAGWVSDGDFSPGGERVVTSGFDGKVAVWNVTDGALVKDLPTDGVMASCVAWSPVEGRIAVGNRDGTVRVYSDETGQEVMRLAGHTDRVRDVAFTPDGRHVVSGNYDRTLRVWNVETGAEVARVEHEKHIFNALAMAPDGRHVFSAGGIWKPDEEKNEWTPENDYAVRMWRLPQSVWPQAAAAPVAEIKEAARLSGHNGPVFGLAVAGDGATALSTSDDYSVREWSLSDYKPLREIAATGALRGVALSPDGQRAAWSGGQKKITVWDLKENKELKTLTGHTNWVYGLQFTKDGKRLLSISRDKTVRLWDIETGESVLELETIDRQDIVARLSPDETKILASSDNAFTLAVWNVADGQKLVGLHGHGVEGVYAAAWSPDGTKIATADARGFLFLRDAATGEPTVTFRAHDDRITALEFTSDGRHLVSGGFDRKLAVWDAATGRLVARATADTHATNHLAVLPGGKQVLSGGGWALDREEKFLQDRDYALRLWDLPESVRTLATPPDAVSAPAAAVAPFDAARGGQLQQAWADHLSLPVEYTSPLGMKFRLIPPGEFDMGSSAIEASRLQPQDEWFFAQWARDRRQKEMPRRRVRITRPFYLGAHEVTIADFRQFIETSGYQARAERDAAGGPGYASGQWKQDKQYRWNSPGFVQGDDHPVVNLAWDDAAAFCEWLSQQGHGACRLPTEAEWEYACRAGTTTLFSSGDEAATLEGAANLADQSLAKAASPVAWHAAWDDQFAHSAPIGKFQPNAFGLFDMHGNASEWCLNWYGDYNAAMTDDPPGPPSGSRHVFRGGAFDNWVGFARSADRYSSHSPTLRTDWAGFRIVLAVDGVKAGLSQAKQAQD